MSDQERSATAARAGRAAQAARRSPVWRSRYRPEAVDGRRAMPAGEFQRTWRTTTEPVVVTAWGRPIGLWTPYPGGQAAQAVRPDQQTTSSAPGTATSGKTAPRGEGDAAANPGSSRRDRASRLAVIPSEGPAPTGVTPSPLGAVPPEVVPRSVHEILSRVGTAPREPRRPLRPSHPAHR